MDDARRYWATGGVSGPADRGRSIVCATYGGAAEPLAQDQALVPSAALLSH